MGCCVSSYADDGEAEVASDEVLLFDKEASDIEARWKMLAARYTESFCGPKTELPAAEESSVHAAIPTPKQIAADTPVSFSAELLAEAAAEEVTRGEGARKVLLCKFKPRAKKTKFLLSDIFGSDSSSEDEDDEEQMRKAKAKKKSNKRATANDFMIDDVDVADSDEDTFFLTDSEHEDGSSGLAEAAAVFVEGRYERKDRAIKKQQSKAAVDWLIQAMQAAHLDQEIAEGVKKLLAVFDFTANLGARGQWQRLQVELGQAMAALGAKRLAPLFDQFDLGTVMSAKTISKLFSIHPLAANLDGQKPSQELAMPALFSLIRNEINFDDPAAFGQRVALYVMRILFVLLNDRFQKMIAKVAEKAGCKYSGAAAKGYSRALVKLYKDYLKLSTPRAAFILDGLRALLTGDGVLSVHAAIGKLSELFEGLIQVKDPFDLPLDEREARNHLLLVNVTGVFDPNTTVKDLLDEPATKPLLAKMHEVTESAGEPNERHQRLFDEAVAVLRHPSLAAEQVKILVEVQITFTAYSDVKDEAHNMYDGSRAVDSNSLAAAFSGLMEEEVVADDLESASSNGQLSAARRLVLEEGADVNTLGSTGKSALYRAAERNHCDVLAFLLESRADVNLGRTSNGMTPLFFAVQNDYGEVVQQLLGANADVSRCHGSSTPLYWAARNGSSAVVQQLLDANADVNEAETDTGKTPLSIAMSHGHTEVVQQLVDANADVNKATSDDGTPPLFSAAQEGHSEVVQQLVDANADVNQTTTAKAKTPLYMAATEGHSTVVQQLVNAKADVNQASTVGVTPLYMAAQEGHRKVVQQLVDANADVNKARTEVGTTPLYMAARRGHSEVVQQLMDANADVNLASSNGVTPLYEAAQKGHSKIVHQLVDANADVNKAKIDDGETPLYTAAMSGHSTVVQQLVNAKADVNQASTVGTTPLYVAAQEGHRNVVQQLVDANADVNKATSDDGTPPLFSAAQEGHSEVVQQLVDANADVNQTTTAKAKTPLYMAATEGHSTVVQQLVNAKADVNQASTVGTTPLYMAAQEGHSEVVQQLVGANADVNKARTDIGTTPLYMAARRGHSEVVQQLMDANADINQAAIDGRTSLFAAAQKGHNEVVQQLVDANADVNKARTDNGETPLFIAEKKAHTEVVETLIAAGAK